MPTPSPQIPASDDRTEKLRRACAVVIPVYNHAAHLAAVVAAARNLGMPVIVVDDGSTDRTADLLPQLPGITRLRHAENRGKGAALLTGMRTAAGMAAWAVTLDADGQHDPADALTLLRAVPAGRRPIVVGARRGMNGQAVPWTSRSGREFSNFWVRVSGGPKLRDSQSGLRLYPLPETLALGVRARRYQFEVEVLVKAAWRGLAVVEAPISVSYAPGGRRISHFRPFRDFVRNSSTFSRLICQRLLLPARRRR